MKDKNLTNWTITSLATKWRNPQWKLIKAPPTVSVKGVHTLLGLSPYSNPMKYVWLLPGIFLVSPLLARVFSPLQKEKHHNFIVDMTVIVVSINFPTNFTSFGKSPNSNHCMWYHQNWCRIWAPTINWYHFYFSSCIICHQISHPIILVGVGFAGGQVVTLNVNVGQ